MHSCQKSVKNNSLPIFEKWNKRQGRAFVVLIHKAFVAALKKNKDKENSVYFCITTTLCSLAVRC